MAEKTSIQTKDDAVQPAEAAMSQGAAVVWIMIVLIALPLLGLATGEALRLFCWASGVCA